MPVALQILSGTRQGERVELDVPEFRAGDAPSCELFFDAAREPAARGKLALFRLSDDGWRVRNLGAAGVLVNDRPVSAAVHLRSGDVVRLSAAGPDFSFQLIAHLSAKSETVSAPAVASPIMPAAVPAPTWLAASSTAPPPTYAPMYAAPAPIANPAAPLPPTTVEPARMEGPPGGAAIAGRVILLVAGLALAVAMLVLVREFPADRGSPASVVDSPHEGETNTDGAAPASDEDDDKRVPSGVELPADTTETTSSNIGDGRGDESGSSSAKSQKFVAGSNAAPRETDWNMIAAAVREALWLVAVEEPKSQTAWPFAVATAVRHDAALTSATVATELKRFQAKQWKVWLTRPGSDQKLSVGACRAHLGFASAPGDATRQIYDDFGMLSVNGELERVCPMASGDERRAVSQGMPLACLAIVYEWEPITRYQTYEPRLLLGKARLITALNRDEPDSPRLVHAAMKMPAKAYGSPVLNAVGHLIGVYAETVPRMPEQPDAVPELQYVPIFDARWLSADEASGWVE